MSYREDMRAAAARSLRKALARSKGNISLAARIAGLHRGHFYKLCAKHGVVIRTQPSRYVNRGNTEWRGLQP